MDAETVQTISALTLQADGELTREITLQNGKEYTYRNNPTEHGRALGEMLTPPKVSLLGVTTLTGFVDALQMGIYDPTAYLVHVEEYDTVSLKERAVDMWGARATHIKAEYEAIDAFRFDTYYSDLPKFIIALQTAFLQTEEMLYLIRIASNLKAGNTVQSQDDGFSQTITVKTGEVSTAEVKVAPRIKLIPLRSFAEAAPVESEFLIRFQQTPQQAPSIALFDVSGNKWKGEQMLAIKKWLAEQISPEFAIIA